MAEKIELRRGLKDVYIDRSKASFIDGKEGTLIYQGYNIHDLAENSTFEETIYLLLYGKLPTQNELDDFEKDLRSNREIPDSVIEIIKMIKNAHPMDVLRTAVSALSAHDPEADDNSIEATLRKGIRLTAQAPTIVTTHARILEGKDPVASDPELNQAANFLYTLFGTKPDPEDAKVMDTDFILHAEHGINASAFAARVAASTDSDLHSAIVAGIATLKGPKHGGAAESVTKMAMEIGEEDKAEEYVKKTLKGGGRIMGFGHRVYKTVDPRSIHIMDRARHVADRKGQPKWFQILSKVAEVMKPYEAKGVCVNVDFWTGAVYQLLGIPEKFYISIFSMGRVPGWTLQVMEQFDNNMLLRPMLEYTGPINLEYVPIGLRK